MVMDKRLGDVHLSTDAYERLMERLAQAEAKVARVEAHPGNHEDVTRALADLRQYVSAIPQDNLRAVTSAHLERFASLSDERLAQAEAERLVQQRLATAEMGRANGLEEKLQRVEALLTEYGRLEAAAPVADILAALSGD